LLPLVIGLPALGPLWAGLRLGAGERQEMGWGGGLILSKAQKSATAPAHLLLVNVVGQWPRYVWQMFEPVFMTGRQRTPTATTGNNPEVKMSDLRQSGNPYVFGTLIDGSIN